MRTKIVFLVPNTIYCKQHDINGDTIRYGGAASSGTDQSVILLSEYLASTGKFDVTIVINNSSKKIVNNVKYTDFTYEGLVDGEIDFLVSCLWFEDYDKLPFKVNKGLIYWYHLAWGYGRNEIVEFCNKNNISFAAVSPSYWAEYQISKTNELGHLLDAVNNGSLCRVIPNPLMTDMLPSEESCMSKIPKSSIFHAQFNRGALITEKILKELKWPDLTLCGYLRNEKSLDKSTLFKTMANTEYFIFPLFNTDPLNSSMLKDTFSCSVAEALAMGVLVVTYKIGAIPEYFGDYCTFAEYPEGAIEEQLINERVTCNKTHELANTKTIIDKLNYLESNPRVKEELKRKGMEYVRKTFTPEIIGREWEKLINDLNNKSSKKIERNLTDIFDKHGFNNKYYINIDERSDRDSQCKEEFNKVKIYPKRFNAVNLSLEYCNDLIDNRSFNTDKPLLNKSINDIKNIKKVTRGQISCASSHLSLINKAKQQRFPNITIFEDDVFFIDKNDFYITLDKCLTELNTLEWDIFYLGATLNAVDNNYNNPNLFKVISTYACHAYVINNSAYDRILSYNFNEYFAIDCYIDDLIKSGTIRAYASKIPLAFQRTSHSNIQGHVTESIERFMKDRYNLFNTREAI